jgi:hypothetical protein
VADATAYYQRMRRHTAPKPEPRPADPAVPPADVRGLLLGSRTGRLTPPDGWIEEAVLADIADGFQLANADQVTRLAREVRYWRTLNKGAAA